MITTQDILSSYDNKEWLGFGYLGARRNALIDEDPECPAQPARVAEADEFLVAHANRQRWSTSDLFEWLNSRHGRWYADVMFGGTTWDEATEMVTRQSLLELP